MPGPDPVVPDVPAVHLHPRYGVTMTRGTGLIITLPLSPGLVFYRCGELPSPGRRHNTMDMDMDRMDMMDRMETLYSDLNTVSMNNPWNLTLPGHTSDLPTSSIPGPAPLASGDHVTPDTDR